MIVDRKQSPRRIEQLLAHGGERDTGRALVEQFNAEQRLEAANLAADRWLRHALRPGDAGEAAQLYHQNEGAQHVSGNIGHA